MLDEADCNKFKQILDAEGIESMKEFAAMLVKGWLMEDGGLSFEGKVKVPSLIDVFDRVNE